MGTVRSYLLNCFLLILPALVVNLAWAPRLPAMWQFDSFWDDIPPALFYGENISRIAVNVLPALMPLRISTRRQKVGIIVYSVGLLIYFLAWVMVVYFPGSTWSTNLIGATAPAWTSLPWLVGIGLVGSCFYFSIPYRPWMYVTLSLAFATVHTLHAEIVYERIH